MIDARIYVSHTKACPVLGNDLFVPLQAGRQQADEALPDMVGDDTGDHISDRYSQWGELTSLYWVWKNTQQEYVGWMRAARLLSLVKGGEDGALEGFSQRSIRHYGWTLAGARSLLKHYDIVVPRAYDVQEITALQEVETPHALYVREGGTAQEIALLLRVIEELYPEKYIHALEFFYGHSMRPWNLFVMKQELFQSYGAFLFSVLEAFKSRHDMEGHIGCQRHNWTFLAECLFNIDIIYRLAVEPSLKLREQPILFVDGNDLSFDRRKVLSQQAAHARAIKTASPKEVEYGGHVHIVLSFNDRYLKPACATINSILAHTANKNDITFYVLHDEGLSQSTIHRMEDIYEGEAHFYFIKVKDNFVHKFPLNRKHINVNAYYRLILQNMIPHHIDRIIYLDTDTIICGDIVDLWNFNLNNNIIAGVLDESGIVCSWRLWGAHMNDRYINSGVLLLDLKQAREKYGNLDFLYARSFYENDVNITMQDQDILNIAYKDDIALLPLNWNVPSSVYYRKSAHSDGDYEGRENVFSDQERQDAVNHPKIIHFTGKQKPWKFNSMHPLKALFWSHLRRSVRLSLREYLLSLNNVITIKKGEVILRRNRDFTTLFSIENLKRNS